MQNSVFEEVKRIDVTGISMGLNLNPALCLKILFIFVLVHSVNLISC